MSQALFEALKEAEQQCGFVQPSISLATKRAADVAADYKSRGHATIADETLRTVTTTSVLIPSLPLPLPTPMPPVAPISRPFLNVADAKQNIPDAKQPPKLCFGCLSVLSMDYLTINLHSICLVCMSSLKSCPLCLLVMLLSSGKCLRCPFVEHRLLCMKCRDGKLHTNGTVQNGVFLCVVCASLTLAARNVPAPEPSAPSL